MLRQASSTCAWVCIRNRAGALGTDPVADRCVVDDLARLPVPDAEPSWLLGHDRPAERPPTAGTSAHVDRVVNTCAASPTACSRPAIGNDNRVHYGCSVSVRAHPRVLRWFLFVVLLGHDRGRGHLLTCLHP